MSEFYLFAEQNGVKWYKCKRCQAAARDKIPAVCPICGSSSREYTLRGTPAGDPRTLEAERDLTRGNAAHIINAKGGVYYDK